MKASNNAALTETAMIVGVDDGHDGIKIYAGSNKQYRLPARVQVGIKNLGDADQVNEEIIIVENTNYTVSENLTDYADTRTEEYPVSTLNRALVYQALRRSGIKGKHFKIATGLPVNRFYGGENRSLNHPLINAKVKNLLNIQNSTYNKLDDHQNIFPICISKHIVFCEAQAAYFDCIINDDGSASKRSNALLEYGAGIIDIGGRTTDVVVMNPKGKSMQSDRSHTIDEGIINLRRNISDQIKSKLKIQQISEKMLSNAIETGFYGATNNFDVQEIVQTQKLNLVEQLSKMIDANIKGGTDLGGVIVVGGGSIILKKELQARYPDWIYPDNPEFANARGMFKAAKFITRI